MSLYRLITNIWYVFADFCEKDFVRFEFAAKSNFSLTNDLINL